MAEDFDVIELEATDLNIAAVLQATREFAVIDAQEKTLGKRKAELKSRLRGLVELEGTEDDKGNLIYELPEVCGDITALQLQCRVARPFDGDAAKAILGDIPTAGDQDFTTTLWDDCVELVPVLDESKVMAAHYQGLITEGQIDAMYPEHTTFAFVPLRISS